MSWRALVCGLALAFAAGACASAAAQLRKRESPSQLRARRVAQILERHHPSHAPLDATTAGRTFERLLHALDPATGCAGARVGLDADAARVAEAIRAGDFDFALRAARACAGRALAAGEAETLVLDALAGAYDPFCNYLDPTALARRRASTHASLASGGVARGRMLARAGVRAGWIELPSFYLRPQHSASADVAVIARELGARGAQLLLLDLRGNGGGVIAEALALASALLGGGVLAHERDAGGEPRGLQAPIRAPLWNGPLVLLIDRGTASMAELFAAALQDRARALLVGERSYGKGLAQTLVLLGSPLGTSDGAVEVSERAFYRLDGGVLQGRGVTPDVEIAFAEQSPARPAPFVAPWLPERIAPLIAPTPRALAPAALARARSAAHAPAADDVQRVLAVAIAYATMPAGGPR